MFGHTFLRIDSSFKSRLLSHAVNYSANADENTENGFSFAIKGLIGGYIGKFSMLPYYDKLKEYRDAEQRDIWEYDLNLNQDEVKRMVDHIWEVSNSFSYYYFLDENCSYNMLWLLEVARPNIHLREHFTYHVSPPETIFAIEKEGLVKEKKYRPSKRSILLAYEDKLSSEYLDIVKNLSLGETKVANVLNNSTILKKDMINIFETSIEMCEYNYIKNKIDKEKYLDTVHNLSKARATLGKGEKLNIPTPPNPDLGNRQLKVSIGTAKELNSKTDFLLIGLRPTYHDLTDNDIGFLRGTQIEFFNTQLIYSKEEKLEFDYFKFVTISSIAPRTELFKSYSWKTAWQFDRDGLDNELNFNANVGGGFAWDLFAKSYFYILADFYLYDSEYARSALGSTIGLVLYEGDSFKTNIETIYKKYNSDDSQNIVNITQSYYINSKFDLKLKYKFIEKFDEDQEFVSLQLNYFF